MERTTMISDFNSSNYDSNDSAEWIALTTISIVLAFAYVWVITAMIYYGIKTGKWRRMQSSSQEKLNAGLIYSAAIGCTVSCLLHQITLVLYANIKLVGETSKACNVMSDLLKSSYALVVFTVNLFLWFRQNAFYTNRMLNINISKPIRVYSFLSIFAVFLAGVAGLILTNLSDDEMFLMNHCVYLPEKNYRSYSFTIVSLVVIFGQVSLLSLFINVLVKSKSTTVSSFAFMRNSLCDCCKTNRRNTKHKLKQNDLTGSPTNNRTIHNASIQSQNQFENSAHVVRLIVFKSSVFALVSVLADVSVIAATFFVTERYQTRKLVLYIGNLAVFLNISFIVMSFVQWRKIMKSPISLSTD